MLHHIQEDLPGFRNSFSLHWKPLPAYNQSMKTAFVFKKNLKEDPWMLQVAKIVAKKVLF